MKSMKRSVYVGFSMAALGAAATLSACGPTRDPNAKDVSIYKTVEDCAKEQPRAECEAALASAKAEQSKDAPNFRDRAACEQQWGSGRCEERHASGGSFFIPALVGFTLGQALANHGRPAYCPPTDPRCSAASGFGGHGVYVGTNGGLFAGRDRIGDAPSRGGSFEVPRTASVAPGEGGHMTSGVTRGGFGRMAGIRGGAGG